mmetsp:Transcript_35630/g.34658  ORF Transcript_35630/g.34658 Transcript_35630/m.34658 type:complete len:184 (+) Transcript_35630:328-879(+)
METFVSSHSIMIRGINEKLGIDQSNSLIRRVFVERFGLKKVIAVSTVRFTENVQNIFRKRQVYKAKLAQFKMQNLYQEQREMINLRGRVRCFRRLVDAESYFEKKLEEVEEEWEQLKKSANYQNVGVAFVTFKDKDCVKDTIEELELVKSKLVGKSHYDDLDIKNWEVEQAQPTNDIIWNEIN